MASKENQNPLTSKDNLKKRVLPKQLTSKKGEKKILPDIFSSQYLPVIILAMLAVLLSPLLFLMWWSRMLLFLFISSAFLCYQVGLDWKTTKKLVLKVLEWCWLK